MMKQILQRYIQILHALLSIPIFMVLVFVMIFIERHYGLHGLFFMGDIDAFFGVMIVGSIVFTLGNMVMIGFEQPRKMTARDHLRQSGFLYFGLVSLLVGIIFFVTGYYNFLTTIVLFIGFGKMAPFLGLVILWGIITNAIFLWVYPKISNEIKKGIVASLILTFFFFLLLGLCVYYLTKKYEERHGLLIPVSPPHVLSDLKFIKPAPIKNQIP